MKYYKQLQVDGVRTLVAMTNEEVGKLRSPEWKLENGKTILLSTNEKTARKKEVKANIERQKKRRADRATMKKVEAHNRDAEIDAAFDAGAITGAERVRIRANR